MRTNTKRLFAEFVFAYEERCLLHAGTCACLRPRDRLDTPELRAKLDKLVNAVNDEPETIDASRVSLCEVDR
jgi:hypothetical protein